MVSTLVEHCGTGITEIIVSNPAQILALFPQLLLSNLKVRYITATFIYLLALIFLKRFWEFRKEQRQAVDCH